MNSSKVLPNYTPGNLYLRKISNQTIFIFFCYISRKIMLHLSTDTRSGGRSDSNRTSVATGLLAHWAGSNKKLFYRFFVIGYNFLIRMLLQLLRFQKSSSAILTAGAAKKEIFLVFIFKDLSCEQNG
jgi:hypothetical protein